MTEIYFSNIMRDVDMDLPAERRTVRVELFEKRPQRRRSSNRQSSVSASHPARGRLPTGQFATAVRVKRIAERRRPTRS